MTDHEPRRRARPAHALLISAALLTGCANAAQDVPSDPARVEAASEETPAPTVAESAPEACRALG